MDKKKAVVLLSGGIDSATTAAVAIHDGFEVDCMTFMYGQRHDIELASARKIAGFFGIRDHVFIDIPSGIFSSSLMKGSEESVPKDGEPDGGGRIPSTYVPARNILFLSYALAYGESRSAEAIFIGANAIDYSGYPDCRPEFFEAFQIAADRGTRSGISGGSIRIETPLILLKKYEILRLGRDLGVDYSLTHSCYDPHGNGYACGRCDSCIIRKRGFFEAGIPDPTRYFGE